MAKAEGNIQLAAKFLERSCHLRSVGIAGNVRQRFAARTMFLRRAADDVVVGEIGGRFVGAGTVEIGYPVVPSCWGPGYATGAAGDLVGTGEARLGGQPPARRPVNRGVGNDPLDPLGSRAPWSRASAEASSSTMSSRASARRSSMSVHPTGR